LGSDLTEEEGAKRVR